MDRYDIISQKLKNKELNIIVLPFGKNGKSATDAFINKGYNIKAIWDNYEKNTSYQNIPIKKPSFEYMNNTILVLSTVFENVANELIEQIKSLGYDTIYDAGSILSYEDLDYDDYRKNYFLIRKSNVNKLINKDLLIVPNVEISVTDKCSLRCKECSNLMQYFTSPKDADIKEALLTADKFLNSIDFLEELRLLGGEPFMYKNIDEYVNFFVKKDNIDTIHIYTNGTIIPSDKVINSLKNKKVFITISNYGNLSRNLENLEKILYDNKIFYRVDTSTTWDRCSPIKANNRTDIEQTRVFTNCCSRRNLTLRNGKLYTCPFIANAVALQAIPESDAEAIEVLNSSRKSLHNNILDYYKKPFIKACDYCMGRFVTSSCIPVAEQVDKPLPFNKLIK